MDLTECEKAILAVVPPIVKPLEAPRIVEDPRVLLEVHAVRLRETDRDVPLDLQALVDLCYRNDGYDDIDYRAEPAPPLGADDAGWADTPLRESGVRSG